MVQNGFEPSAGDLLPTAVLIGGRTASSGEAVAIVFHGRDGVRFFGYPTAGLTTSNEPVHLSDGAMLALTMSVFADRTGTPFGQGVAVTPDETSGEYRTALGDDVIADAEAWLWSQPSCAVE
jgi:C-terminal processing protease CtpA/Prc